MCTTWNLQKNWPSVTSYESLLTDCYMKDLGCFCWENQKDMMLMGAREPLFQSKNEILMLMLIHLIFPAIAGYCLAKAICTFYGTGFWCHPLPTIFRCDVIFPPLSGMLDPCQSSSNNWKPISFDTTWLHPKLKKKKKIYIIILSLLPLLACTYLNNIWDLVLGALVCLPLKDESLYVFPNCTSLWIKVSAKWLNGNVFCPIFTQQRWVAK